MVVPTATAATSLGTTSFTANWTAATVGIVDKYLLDVSTNSNFSSFVTGYNNLDAGSVLTKNITGLTGNTTYYYRVRADKSSVTGQGGNSNTTSTTTAPAAPTLSSPTNNATGSSLSPTLSWSAVSGADKYRLEVNQASDFSGTVIYDQDTVSLNSKQIGSLSDSTKYYWRVSAKNSSGNWGDVSSIFNFTTEQSSLTSPSNGAFSVSLTPTLSWPATTGANKYRLEVNTTSDFTGTVKLDTTTASTSKTMDGVSLIYNTTYYWRVTASSNSLSKTNSSSTYSFTTKLAATTLTSPSDNVTGVSLSPTLNWSSVTGANKYRLEVNTASDFSGTVIYNQDTVSLASKQIGGLSDNTTYYWRVTAKNSGGNSGDVSSIFNFTTTQQSAGTSPVNGSTNNSINPEFIWPVGPTGTNKYRLEVNTNNTFTGTTILDTTTTATSKILGGTSLEYNTLYYWRVTASSNALSKTNTSAVYSFTTQLAASTLISPANNATDVSLSPILIWSATGGTTGYRLEVNTASNFSGTVIYDQDTISQTSEQIGGLIDNTKYYWRVTALTNGGNTSDESSVFNFTTGQASLTSPSDDALSISLTPTFSWPAATGASSYHLEVNTSSDFTGTVKLDTTTSATSKVLNGLSLSNNTTYYWRVTATSSGLWKTNTSSVYSFTTKLATTALSSPTNNATGVSLSPTLSWSSVTGADKYRLEVNTASGFDGEVIYDQDTVGLNTKQIAGLTDSTKYYWRVTALTSSGNYSDYSTVRYFTTVSSVTQSTLIVPESGSTDVPTDPTLSWPVTDGANSFRLEVNTDVNFGSGTIFLDTTGVTSDSLSLAGLEPNTTYYWRVTASSNSLEKTNSSQVFSFTTGAGPLPVELTKFSAKSEDSFVILIWQTATEVNNYGFEVQRSSVSDPPLAWTKIGFVPGAGNSNSPKDYSFKDQPIGGIKFSYRLKQLDVDGNFKYYDAIKVSLNALAKAELMQNSPNPFNPSTSIKFYIPDISSVTIKIYDILGKEVNTLFNEKADAGYHIVYWNGKDKYGQNAASGVYFYRLSTNVGFVQTKKMLLLK